MKTDNIACFTKPAGHQSGLSLVELMVSLVVGLILIYGVSEIYVNSKGTYNVNEEMSRMQESARFSFDLMVPTVRQTGYTGCVSLNSSTPNDIRKAPKDDFTTATVITGNEATSSTVWSPALATGISGNVQGNTDVITVQSNLSCGAQLTGNMGTTNANIQVSPNNTCGFVAGDPILISDCKTSDLFKATNVSKGASKTTIAHANSQNTTNRLSKLYFEDSELYKPTSTSYFIRTGASGLPALMSRDNVAGAAAVELVEGVESMQVLYGVDTDATADGVVNRYVKANAIPVSGNDWDKVIAVRISLLMRSVDGVASASGSYTFDGVSYGADRFIRQEYTSTVQLRNRSLLP
jgi:type IV pilus assembly protein PilW